MVWSCRSSSVASDTDGEGEDVIVTAGAGESWDGLVEFAVKQDLAGIECLSGIPGTVGGTPIQNVGAYGQEVASVIEWVAAFDRATGRPVRLSRAGLRFCVSHEPIQTRGRWTFLHQRGGLPLERCARRRPLHIPMSWTTWRSRRLRVRHCETCGMPCWRFAVGKGWCSTRADPDTRSVGSFFMNPVVDRATFERLVQRHTI